MSTRTVVQTDDAPKAIGPYSQAIATDRLLFCSGQIPLDPKTGMLLGEGDARVQAKRAMDNLGAVLAAGGASFDTVVKTTIFLTNLGDFTDVNEVYASYFKGTPPARSTIQVAALPKGANVEIEAIAIRG